MVAFENVRNLESSTIGPPQLSIPDLELRTLGKSEADPAFSITQNDRQKNLQHLPSLSQLVCNGLPGRGKILAMNIYW